MCNLQNFAGPSFVICQQPPSVHNFGKPNQTVTGSHSVLQFILNTLQSSLPSVKFSGPPVQLSAVNPKLNAGGKKDTLQVSCQFWNECWGCCQSTVKEAYRQHLSKLIQANCHNPNVLLKTIYSVLKPPQPICTGTSLEMCNRFLQYFSDQVSTARALISNTVPHLTQLSIPPCKLFFEAISLTFLEKVLHQMEPCSSPYGSVPPQFI